MPVVARQTMLPPASSTTEGGPSSSLLCCAACTAPVGLYAAMNGICDVCNTVIYENYPTEHRHHVWEQCPVRTA